MGTASFVVEQDPSALLEREGAECSEQRGHQGTEDPEAGLDKQN